jgi:hypothetical protein
MGALLRTNAVMGDCFEDTTISPCTAMVSRILPKQPTPYMLSAAEVMITAWFAG